ncbi:MAG: FIST C-terminal domain-containing protein [Planctomycetota bacterium]|nr:FIST C-terminal domain-containing protein [Planctomycetota bacterium]
MRTASAHAIFAGDDKTENAANAARSLKASLSAFKPAQVLFFAAGKYDYGRLAAAVQDAFPGAITLGCSTSGEIADGQVLAGSVSALAFGEDVFEHFDVSVLSYFTPNGRPADPIRQLENLFTGLSDRLDLKTLEYLEGDKHFFLVLADGRRYFIEPALDRAGDLASVPFFGGIAGDNMNFAYTPTFLNGCVYNASAILALIKPRGRFELVKTQEAVPAGDGRIHTVTRSSPEDHVLFELDGRPAGQIYSEAVGIPVGELNLETAFKRWTLGIASGDDLLLRCVAEVQPDRSIITAAAIPEGGQVRIFRNDDIVNSTARAMAETERRLGGKIGGLLHVSCMIRTLALAANDRAVAFREIFKNYPNAGFASHGEICVNIANASSVMLALADE